MDDKQNKSTGTITSIDGKRTITLEEFDQLFDDGSDEIDAFIDWSRGRVDRAGLEVPVGQARNALLPDPIKKKSAR